MNCCFLANILMGTIYSFAGKFSYIVLKKSVYEKVVEMSTKQRQCQNNPDVFCYIYGEYMMAKCRFNVRDFTKRAYEAYLVRGPRQVLGTSQGVQTSYKNAVVLDPRQSQFDAVWREPQNRHDNCYFCMMDMSESGTQPGGH